MRTTFVGLLALVHATSLGCTDNASNDDEVFTSFDDDDTSEGEVPTTGFPVDTDSDTDSDSTTDGDSSSDDATDSTDGTDTTDDTDTTDGEDDGDPPLGQRPVIYQLVVRHFGNTNQTRATNAGLAENGVGKFVHITDTAIGQLVELGITHVWLTGVLRQATLTNYNGYGMPADDPDTVKGRAGSFYAIRDYYDVSPDYAMDPTMRLEEFDALVERLHAANLRVMIDLVPNHVARGYGSIVLPETDFGVADDQSVFFSPNNNFFYLDGAALQLSKPGYYNPPGFTFDGMFAPENGTPGNVAKVTGNNVTSTSPASTDWYETVKLNWGYDFANDVSDYDPIPDTWLKMDAIVAYWQDRGVDGFRCDFAHYVPNEAWTWLIDEAKMRDPEVYFIAEAYADLDGLLAAGFDAVYHDASYDALKRIYQGAGTQAQYSDIMNQLGDPERPKYLQYLENHDERRIASPVVANASPDDSGFGGENAGYQLAPLAYLYGAGPVLIYNGQEVGEPGSGVEGFGQEDGRTSIFDYWSLIELSKWVNEGAFDGGMLAADQIALRDFYADLLALTQDPSATAAGYWGLEYHNNPGNFGDCPDGLYSFARFEPDSGRALVIVANFTPGQGASGKIRLPQDLVDAIGFAGDVTVGKILDETGGVDQMIGTMTSGELVSAGFSVDIPDQRAHVFVIE
jgi:glycosidase